MIDMLALLICALFLVFIAINTYGWFFSRMLFWHELSVVYRCSRSEFKGIPDRHIIESSFIYNVDNEWVSTNFIDTKVIGDYVYFGVNCGLILTVRPIKVLKSDCVLLGEERAYFRKRKVYLIPSCDGFQIKVAMVDAL